MRNIHSVTLCGEKLLTPMHICGFFDSQEEQYDVILPYLREGLENNEKVISILESSAHHEHCTHLSQTGIPVKEKLANGQLSVLSPSETY